MTAVRCSSTVLRLIYSFAAVLVFLLHSACSTAPVSRSGVDVELPSLESDLFGGRQNIISTSAVHELSEKQRIAFQRYFDDPRNANSAAHERVFDYLTLVTNDFSYRGETYTAEEALDYAAGNCLALAILTTALAQLADVDIGYQLADSFPVFQSHGRVIARGLHVRSILYDPTWVPKENFVVMSRPGIKVDYFPSDSDRFVGNIGAQEYASMCFRNIAAKAIGEEDLAKAYRASTRSLYEAKLAVLQDR